MRKNISKSAKSVLAVALCAALAVPAVSALTAPAAVSAEEEETEALPDPVAVYDFNEDMDVTFSALSLTASNEAVVVNDEAMGKVLSLKDAISVVATKESVKIVTMNAADYDESIGEIVKDYEFSEGDKAGAEAGTIIAVSKKIVVDDDLNSYNINSSAEIKNPFAGRDDLVEEPIDYLDSCAPIWETGVTVSYWMKTNGKGTEEETESPILTFNREKEGMTHKDDRDKQRLAKIYQANPDNPLFKAGVINEYSKADFPTEYNGLPVTKPSIPGKQTRRVITDYGIFACMNPEFNPEGGVLYYFKLNASGDGYTLERSSCSRIDLSKYLDVEAEGSLARYGTEKGCLTFLASGGYAFTETGLVEKVFKGGKEYSVDKESERQFQRNTLRAYTYLQAGEEKSWQGVIDAEDTVGDALVENTEWHFITYVIKNDSISLYVDGVVQDETMYTDTTAESTLIVGQSFNRGFGYHNSAAPQVFFPDIISSSGGEGMFTQGEGYLIGGKDAKTLPENIITDLYGDGTTGKYIGYNGNCNADTLMQYITDENTKLFIGEDGPSSAADLLEVEFGSKEGTAIGKMIFHDVPFAEDQVAQLYEEQFKEPEPEPIVPSYGDANNDGEVNLTDALAVLKVALGIDSFEEGSQEFINSDVDNDKTISLGDCLIVLKLALGIIEEV